MNCLFCSKTLTYYRYSLRYIDCDEFCCESCRIVGLSSTLTDYDISRHIIHRRGNRILFHDISIGLVNMEHDIEKNTTSIAEWKFVKSRIELVPYCTVPLCMELNNLSLKKLKEKIKLYMVFS